MVNRNTAGGGGGARVALSTLPGLEALGPAAACDVLDVWGGGRTVASGGVLSLGGVPAQDAAFVVVGNCTAALGGVPPR